MNMIPSDTTVDAAAKQYEIFRGMDINARAEITFQLCDNLRQTVEAGVRYRHPDLDQDAVNLAVVRLMIGKSLFREIFGNIEIPL